MKVFNHQYLAICALLLFALSAQAVPQGSVIGQITTVVGTVTGTDQDGDGFTVAVGADVYAGYSFVTANRSIVGVEMNDGTSLILSGNSQGSLDSFSYNPARGTGSFDATITQGRFRYESGMLASLYPSNAVHSRISTPKAVIGVRGTIIVATVRPDGSIQISIPAGAVSVTFRDEKTGEEVTVSVGEGEEERTIEVSADGEMTGHEELPAELMFLVDEIAEVLEEKIEQADADGESAEGEYTVDSVENTLSSPAGGGTEDIEPVSPIGTAPQG